MWEGKLQGGFCISWEDAVTCHSVGFPGQLHPWLWTAPESLMSAMSVSPAWPILCATLLLKIPLLLSNLFRIVNVKFCLFVNSAIFWEGNVRVKGQIVLSVMRLSSVFVGSLSDLGSLGVIRLLWGVPGTQSPWGSPSAHLTVLFASFRTSTPSCRLEPLGRGFVPSWGLLWLGFPPSGFPPSCLTEGNHKFIQLNFTLLSLLEHKDLLKDKKLVIYVFTPVNSCHYTLKLLNEDF